MFRNCSSLILSLAKGLNRTYWSNAIERSEQNGCRDKGSKVPEVCKQLGISEQTYYRWRQKYGGMAPEMAKHMKALEKKNVWLKRLVAIISNPPAPPVVGDFDMELI